jgi:hypothetical protein
MKNCMFIDRVVMLCAVLCLYVELLKLRVLNVVLPLRVSGIFLSQRLHRSSLPVLRWNID